MERLDGLVIDGKYQLKEPVGAGGMGAVYLAKDLKLDTYWAIKVIEKAKGEEIDLLAEPNMLKSLQHPALPRITDISETKDYIYIIMDFIDGRNLESIAVEKGRIEEETVVQWGKEICDVLEYLHNQKPNPIIYRDMKPSNLMLTKDNRIKLIDFGIAREFKKESSNDTEYLGTRGYAAPEQYKNSSFKSQTDVRTDIYGLGVTLYRLLTGKRPDEPPYELKPLREIDGSLTEGIEYIILKATELDPELRYENIKKLKIDLENVNKLGINFEKEQKKRKMKLGTGIGVAVFSLALLINGWAGYSNELDGHYNQYISRGIEYRNKLDFEGAIGEFTKAQSYIKGKEEGYYEIVKTYIAQWSLDEALRYLNQEVTVNSFLKNNDYTNYLFGKLYFLKTNYKEANKYLRKIRDEEKIDKDFKEIKLLSDELEDLNNINIAEVKLALENFEKFIDDNLSDKVMALNLYLALGDVYFQVSANVEDSNDRQIEILKKAYKLSADNYVVLDRLAMAYLIKANSIRMGDIEKYNELLTLSLETYYKCLDIQPSIDVYKNIGDIYFSLNKIEESKSFYQKMIDLNSNHYLGYLKMSRLYFSMGDMENSKEFLSKSESCENLRTNDPQYNSLKNSLR